MTIDTDRISNNRIEIVSNDPETYWTFENETLKILELYIQYRDKRKFCKMYFFLDYVSIH